LPANTTEAIYWTIENSPVASITATGFLTAKSTGTVTVYAQSENGHITASLGLTIASPVGAEYIVDNLIKVWIYSNRLHVESSKSENVIVYTITGKMIFKEKKPEGKTWFNIKSLPKGILIIKGESGWERKLINQ
jgi:hypothetical protein